jgi:hypothetical protein
LFPFTCSNLGDRALRQGIATYECGQSLIHFMVSESDLLSSAYAEDIDARLACARYIFASALTWPIRIPYLVFALFVLAIDAAMRAFFHMLITYGGKLLLSCRHCIRF